MHENPAAERSARQRVALITGGASGLGLACALRLAQAGVRIAIIDVNEAAARAATKQLPVDGGPHTWAIADVTRPEQATAAVQHTRMTIGAPTILINAAGILRPTPFLEISLTEWDTVIAVSITGSFLMCQACLPAMIQAGHGRIINVSSTAGKNVSTLGGAHYTTAKAGILGLTRAVAKEYAGHGITVNALCPGLFDTPMVRRSVDTATLRALAESFPVGRLGQPFEVAALVFFLCSPEAAYITGAAIDINGGDLML